MATPRLSPATWARTNNAAKCVSGTGPPASWTSRPPWKLKAAAPLSLRQFEAELKRLGLPVALANISLMKFALDKLAPLGQRLTGLDVKRLQPRMNLLKRFAALWAMDEAAFQERIVDPVLHEHVLSLAPEAGAEAERLMRRA